MWMPTWGKCKSRLEQLNSFRRRTIHRMCQVKRPKIMKNEECNQIMQPLEVKKRQAKMLGHVLRHETPSKHQKTALSSSSSLSFKYAFSECGCGIGYEPTENESRSLLAVDIQGHQCGDFCIVPNDSIRLQKKARQTTSLAWNWHPAHVSRNEMPRIAGLEFEAINGGA